MTAYCTADLLKNDAKGRLKGGLRQAESQTEGR